MNSCNNLVDIIRLVARLFQQVRYSHDITILLQPCVVNFATFLLYHDCIRLVRTTIVFRDMVWKLSKLQSGYNELCVYVEPYLTPCTSFVLGLLIFK